MISPTCGKSHSTVASNISSPVRSKDFHVISRIKELSVQRAEVRVGVVAQLVEHIRIVTCPRKKKGKKRGIQQGHKRELAFRLIKNYKTLATLHILGLYQWGRSLNFPFFFSPACRAYFESSPALNERPNGGIQTHATVEMQQFFFWVPQFGSSRHDALTQKLVRKTNQKLL